MIDQTTNKPIRVCASNTSIGVLCSIRVPYAQLAALRQLLDAHGFRYWVSQDIISIDGGPEMTRVELYRGTDPEAVQAVLSLSQ